MARGGPRPTFDSVNRSESNPADGGGDGIGATGALKSANIDLGSCWIFKAYQNHFEYKCDPPWRRSRHWTRNWSILWWARSPCSLKPSKIVNIEFSHIPSRYGEDYSRAILKEMEDEMPRRIDCSLCQRQKHASC